jgi:ABC-type sugar transport system ATPase subunit
MMLGRALESYTLSHHEIAPANVAALSVRDLRIPAALYGVSFDLHAGEVLGIAGLIGSGRSELMSALGGIVPRSAGDVLVEGSPVPLSSPAEAQRQSIFFLPEDRKTEGIFPDLTVLENLVLNTGAGNGGGRTGVFLKLDDERKQYEGVRQALAIRAQSPSQLISSLSGGNQQKVMLGRALVSQSHILLLNEPTRGVDVGTKVEIHALIRKLAKDGHAVLVSSSDVPELVHISDRCLVLSKGRARGLLTGEEITEDNILAAAIGHIGSAATPQVGGSGEPREDRL